MIPAEGAEAMVQGTAVAVDGRGALIVGPSGSGKSALALQLIGLGARLIADDLVALQATGAGVVARCPRPDLSGVIEARGMGLLNAPATPPAGALLALVVTLPPAPESPRLPPPQHIPVLGHLLPLVAGLDGPHFPVALMLQLRHGRRA